MKTKKSIISIFLRTKNYISSRKFALLFTCLYTTIVGLVILNRFWQFEAFYYDQGLFERAIWLVAHGKAPIIDHQTLGRVRHFADHFVPSLYLMFSPWYWFTSRYDITLIALTFYTGLSFLVAYEITRLKISNPFMRYALLFAFTGYVGLQNALIFFIHDLTAMLLPLMLLVLALFKEKWLLFYILFLINLGFKETVAAVGLGLGIFMWLYNSKWRKHAVVISILSLAYGLIVTKYVIPYFSGGKFLYNPIWPNSIFDFFKQLVDTKTKVQVIVVSLLTFGLLPLFVPTMYPLLLQDLILRFVISDKPSQRWDLGLHYNANLAVFLFIAAVLGFSFLEKRKIIKGKLIYIYATLIAIVVFYLHQFVLHGPLGLVYNPEFYRHTGRQGFMHDFINRIPRRGKIMVQNNVAVFFTHDDLYIISTYDYFLKIKPDIIAVDLRSGQNPNNFWPINEKNLQELVIKVRSDPNYKLIYNDGDRYIFTKQI